MKHKLLEMNIYERCITSAEVETEEGVYIHYETYGTGEEKLMLIIGLASTRKLWYPNVSRKVNWQRETLTKCLFRLHGSLIMLQNFKFVCSITGALGKAPYPEESIRKYYVHMFTVLELIGVELLQWPMMLSR